MSKRTNNIFAVTIARFANVDVEAETPLTDFTFDDLEPGERR